MRFMISFLFAIGCATHAVESTSEQQTWNPEQATRQALDMLGMDALPVEEAGDLCTMSTCIVYCYDGSGNICVVWCDGTAYCN